MTRNCAIQIFRWTYRRRLIFTGSARVTCAAAVRDRFLRSGRACYMPLNFFFKACCWYLVLLKWANRPVDVIRLMWQSQNRQLSPQCSGTGIVAEGSCHVGCDAALLGELVLTLRNIKVPSKTASLQMKTLRSFKMPGTTDPATEPYVPEDLNPASYHGTMLIVPNWEPAWRFKSIVVKSRKGSGGRW